MHTAALDNLKDFFFLPTDYMHCEKVPVFVICMYNSEYQKYERNKDVELFLYVMQTEWLYKFNNNH